MVYRDPRCVYIAYDPGIADVVANWLGHEGIEAQVMNRATLGGLLGLTPWSSSGVATDGIEVWVKRQEDAKPVLQMIEEHGAFQAKTTAQKSNREPVEAACEECGETAQFPGSQRGTVQDCPHCSAYMDVPGDDEFDWSDAELGESEPG